MADEGDDLQLVIMLEIVRYLRLREERAGSDARTRMLIGEVVSNLPPGVTIGTLLDAQRIEVSETVMGDKYTTGQAGAVGPNSMAVGQQFQQIWSQSSNDIDLPELARQLTKVRDQARSSASGTPQEDVALAELARAEVAAQDGDGPRTLSHLARAGKWALGIAQAIGVPVAIKALEKAVGS